MALCVLWAVLLLAASETLPVFLTQESILVAPIPRNKTNARTIGYPPCGGAVKGPVHSLAEPGSMNPVAWSVRTPSPSGLCSIRLSRGFDFDHFQPLSPMGVQTTNGRFPCGRNATYMERVIVEFPKDFTCDECTLQWTWETEVGNVYQCVDVQISTGAQSACFGRCKNSGVCINDLCLCPVGYTGLYCEVEESLLEASSVLSIFLLFTLVLLILLIVAAVTYFYVNKYRISRSAYLFFKRYQPWCLKNPDLDYWEENTGNIKSPNMRTGTTEQLPTQ